MDEQLECQFNALLSLARDKAFKLVVDHPDLWWTSPFQGMEKESLEAGIEPFAGGNCYEIDKSGKHRIWGTVLSIEEPLFVRFAWQVSPNGMPIADPATASRVMLSFRESGEATRLEIVHTKFLRHGEDGAAYKNDMAGPNGWPRIIERLQKAAGSGRRL
ncbi:MAG: SRPBCC family protein [Roseibium sp.]